MIAVPIFLFKSIYTTYYTHHLIASNSKVKKEGKGFVSFEGIMEYRCIICPIEDSDLSVMGENEASYLSKISGARLILLHVVEEWYKIAHLATDSKEWDTLHNEWLENGRRLLEREEAKLRKDGVANIDTVLRDGNVVDEILEVAKKKKANLIIMATHRYSYVDKIITGSVSVTERVTKKAPCPVLWIF
jgi:nucleotide-binding universal stress UspA family protein